MSWKTAGGVLAALTFFFVFGACSHDASSPPREGEGATAARTTALETRTEIPRDVHSYSNPAEVRVTHADIDWDVDMAAKKIRGSVTWTLDTPKDAGTDGRLEEIPFVLDTRGLEISRVELSYVIGPAIKLATPRFTLDPPHAAFGSALRIKIPTGTRNVTIHYETTDASSGLQWLDPEQTAGKAQPFLFSQAQAIHARSFLPCQDSPGVRITYSAKVRVPQGLKAVMAARQLGVEADERTFKFEMPQAIPSYLVALAVGDIAFQELGPRTGVYAEPTVLLHAAYEFGDTERMVEAAEALYGPYRWERYDLIVLPPSFPFGGMENPRLTFATPTVLAGDRSLVALVAHELAHSWSGNLVTNATWSDFWLNEGFTVYFERRIIEALYGRERVAMEAMLGKQEVIEEMKTMKPGDTVLHVDLEGRDPDDAFSNVPYEKGCLLLRLIEDTFGRERFDAVLKEWFDANAFQSRTTADFVAHLKRRLLDAEPQKAASLDLDTWLYQPGLPANAPEPKSDAFSRAAAASTSFAAGRNKAEELPGKAWTTHEWLHFLRTLPPDLPSAKLAELDAAWKLSATGNSEILCEWLQMSIRAGYAPADAALARFLTAQGRRKFLKPLYTELAKTPAGKTRALEIYRTARPGYHAIARKTIDDILGWAP